MTIREIAKVFQVSPVTVSNALNNKPGVAPEKAEQIREYAKRMGYQPSFLARSLLNGRSRVVGLCLREVPSDPWSGSLIHRIQNRLYENGLYLNTIVTPPAGLALAEQLEREKWALNFFAQIKAEAILIGPLDMQRFYALSDVLRSHRAVIAFDSIDTLPISHLRLDLAEGCNLVIRLLRDNGHRSIGYVGRNWFEEKHPSDNTRYALIRQLARQYGMEFRSEWSISAEATETDLKKLFASGGRVPTAFFCHNDNFALAAQKVLTEAGMRIPEDVSVVGFDDQPVAHLGIPGITSVGFELEEYIDRLAEFTLAEIEQFQSGRKSEPMSYLAPPRLVLRQSVGLAK